VSQRESGYVREDLDSYPTPAWVTEALLPHLPRCTLIWEPAAGAGGMVAVLKQHCDVIGTDIITGQDFLFPTTDTLADGIVTNPPYLLAQEFIERALLLMEPFGFVAMLLRTDYDHAKTRRHLFGGSAQFAKKVVLTRRIVWFERSKAAPSFNHAWFVWSWLHAGPPVLAYA
jgi:hypothetical protein